MRAVQKVFGDAPEEAEEEADRGTWMKVAILVRSRNAVQCRRKWLFQKAWEEEGGRKQWDHQDDVCLLAHLSEKQAEDEDEIDWTELCNGWESARSACYLRNKWACLRRIVPRYSFKSFQENLDYLNEYWKPHTVRITDPDKD